MEAKVFTDFGNALAFSIMSISLIELLERARGMKVSQRAEASVLLSFVQGAGHD